MSLNRREMLRLGTAGAAGLILSSAAASQVIPGLVMPKPAGTPMAPIFGSASSGGRSGRH